MKNKVVHCKKEPFDIYIGRPSKWGNPFTHLNLDKTKAVYHAKDRDEAVEKYKDWILQQPELLNQLFELKGKTLGCWCFPKRCHGDILAELVSELPEKKD